MRRRAFSARRRANAICSGDTLAAFLSPPVPPNCPLGARRTQLPRLVRNAQHLGHHSDGLPVTHLAHCLQLEFPRVLPTQLLCCHLLTPCRYFQQGQELPFLGATSLAPRSHPIRCDVVRHRLFSLVTAPPVSSLKVRRYFLRRENCQTVSNGRSLRIEGSGS